MSTAELADNATHEEIEEFVDKVVKDAEEESKTDAQRVAEDNDKSTVAETDSGNEDAADDGDETGKEDQAQDWLDDDLRAEVAAYGIDEKELADFATRDELERALRFFDRSALDAGRKAMAEEDDKSDDKSQGDEDEQSRDERGRFAAKERPTEGQYEVDLDPDVYDDGLIGELTKMRDHYESRLATLEERFAEADAKVEEQVFDGIVDSLGHTDLFGKTGKENSKQLERRQDLHVAVKAQQIGLERLGRAVELDQSLVNRVARMVFADELGKKDLKARTRRVSKQSNSRMGGSATKAYDDQEPLMEEMERLYKELDNQ